MFKDSWLTFALFLTLIGLFLSQDLLLFMAALLTTVMVVARLWTHYSLRGLSYKRLFDEERVFVGETVGLTIEVTNQKPLPLSWLRVDDRFPEQLPPKGRKLLPSGAPEVGLLNNVAALSWYEKVRWRYELVCEQRGYYFFGPVQLQSGDIFGIFESEERHEERTRLIVYPQVLPLAKLGLPDKNPFGGRRVNLPVFEDPIRVIGVRDYHPDDPMRRVHWKASARLQKLQVRVWEPAQEQQLMIFLNVTTFAKQWQGVNEALLEWTISVAASICQHAFQEKNMVGLMANASVPNSDQPVKVAAGRSPHQMRFILEALAAITYFATGPIDRLLRAESPKVGWGATFVVVTAVVSEALLVQMLRLRSVGRKLALVSLDNTFTEEQAEQLRIQGITIHRLPHQLTGRSIYAEEETEEIDDSWMQMEDDPHTAFKPRKR